MYGKRWRHKHVLSFRENDTKKDQESENGIFLQPKLIDIIHRKINRIRSPINTERDAMQMESQTWVSLFHYSLNSISSFDLCRLLLTAPHISFVSKSNILSAPTTQQGLFIVCHCANHFLLCLIDHYRLRARFRFLRHSSKETMAASRADVAASRTTSSTAESLNVVHAQAISFKQEVERTIFTIGFSRSLAFSSFEKGLHSNVDLHRRTRSRCIESIEKTERRWRY